MEEYENLPRIGGLPDDKVKRVVLAGGAVFYNDRNPEIPLVEVLLVEADKYECEEKLSDKTYLAKIGAPQVDTVRFGTVFIGNRRTRQIWTDFKGYRENVNFSFDFRNNEPESIHFGAKNQDGQYYIWKSKFSFDAISDKAVKARFLRSPLTKLTTDNGVSVLIPSYEVLTALLVPAEQSIRSKLIINPMDFIVNEYLKSYRHDADSNTYVVEYFGNSKQETNLSFLAYLAMNEISRARISKIYSSVASGSRYSPKYPVVLPYHPSGLNIVCDGIWMDNKTFLCLRVTHMDLPRDFNLKEESEREKKPIEKENTPVESSPKQQVQDFDIDDLPVTPENNPNPRSPRVYIGSEVTVGSIKDIVSKEIITKESDTPIKVSDNKTDQDEPTIKEAPNNLSSGDDQNSQDTQGTGKLNQVEKTIDNPQECIDESDMFTKVIKSLSLLKDDENCPLTDFLYIDNKSNRSSEAALCSFLYKEAKLANSGTKWAYKEYDRKKKIFKPRGALVLELLLKDGERVYLLEIEQKAEEKGFSGLMFHPISVILSASGIKKLLLEIVQLRGRFRTKNGSLQAVDLESVAKSIPYTHYKDKYTKLFVMLFSKMIDDINNEFY